MARATVRPITFARQEDLEKAQGAVNELSARIAVVEYAIEALLEDFDNLLSALDEAADAEWPEPAEGPVDPASVDPRLAIEFVPDPELEQELATIEDEEGPAFDLVDAPSMDAHAQQGDEEPPEPKMSMADVRAADREDRIAESEALGFTRGG